MKMDSIQKLVFSNEEDLFAAVFRFGLRNKGRKLIVAEDPLLRAGFVNYLRARNAIISENKDVDGFCVHQNTPSNNSSKYACTAVINLAGNETMLETRAGVVLFAVFDYNSESAEDYWHRKTEEPRQIDYPHTQCFLMNSELKPIFLNTFAIADEEIDLICPWINTHVVNEKLISLLQQALSRGVKIKITYGIGVDSEDDRQKTSEKTVEMLKTRFSGTELLKFKKGNTHIKYLICDDKYMMCGSYNFLSFAADYVDEDERDEGMEFIVDRNQIVARRRQLFSWN